MFHSIRRLRLALGLAPRFRAQRPELTITDPAGQSLTPRQATWLVVRRGDKLEAQDKARRLKLSETHTDLEAAIELAQSCLAMVRHRQGTQFDTWLNKAATSELGAFRGFAKGLRRDYDAVKASLTLPWSNGPVERHIHRLKMIKRQMFGRAKLDLLEKRFLSPA